MKISSYQTCQIAMIQPFSFRNHLHFTETLELSLPMAGFFFQVLELQGANNMQTTEVPAIRVDVASFRDLKLLCDLQV